MAVEVRIPEVGESIVEVQIGQWLVRQGDLVEKDQPIVELETDKAAVELPSPAAGVVETLLRKPGETAAVGELIAIIAMESGIQPPVEQPTSGVDAEKRQPAAKAAPDKPSGSEEAISTPLPTQAITQSPATAPVAEPKKPPPAAGSVRPDEEVVPISPIRRRIAERLLAAQHNAALLTTFNEIDCSIMQQLRNDYQESFQQRFGVKLGLMSFFVKATVESLKQVPQLNAEIRGDNIVYRNHYDIGIAVAGGKGLLVPVIRNAHRLGFAEIERAVADFAQRAKAGRIELHELEGGTFTITNGGVFGSLLSTPIVNPPQSGVLGLHAIQDRPVVRDGQIVVRPMMYVALTYDHRIVDGREAIAFLRHVKEIIENPSRMLLEV